MLQFAEFAADSIPALYPIETACHPFPWTEKVFDSCIGGRYFNAKATLDDQIVGFYIGDLVVDEATLMDICVAPDFQKQGYGRQLLDHFLDQARARGANTCWLEVRASNISAQMLYINKGFSQTGRRTAYYPANIGYEDAIVMKLAL